METGAKRVQPVAIREDTYRALCNWTASWNDTLTGVVRTSAVSKGRLLLRLHTDYSGAGWALEAASTSYMAAWSTLARSRSKARLKAKAVELVLKAPPNVPHVLYGKGWA